MWKNTNFFLSKEKASKLKKLHKSVSKVGCALMQLGWYSFKVEIDDQYLTGDKVAQISNLPFSCPYSYITVYEDGYVGYHNERGILEFEGRTYGIDIIKKDILRQ